MLFFSTPASSPRVTHSLVNKFPFKILIYFPLPCTFVCFLGKKIKPGKGKGKGKGNKLARLLFSSTEETTT
jgi:hypothetical protein